MIEDSVAAFLNAAIETQTGDGGPTGCLLACVASTQAENDEAVRAFYLAALSSTVSALTERFEAAKLRDYVEPGFPCKPRDRLMVDLMQALALRARAGWTRTDLLGSVAPYSSEHLRVGQECVSVG